MEKVTEEENSPCHHCGAEPGERHRVWDSIARCAYTGIQLIQCHPGEGWENDYAPEDVEFHKPDHECKPDIWDGEWPGVKACREFGWYTSPDSIWGFMEDLNRLAVQGKWNPETEKWEKR